jgi:hypothetical protein
MRMVKQVLISFETFILAGHQEVIAMVEMLTFFRKKSLLFSASLAHLVKTICRLIKHMVVHLLQTLAMMCKMIRYHVLLLFLLILSCWGLLQIPIIVMNVLAGKMAASSFPRETLKTSISLQLQ